MGEKKKVRSKGKHPEICTKEIIVLTWCCRPHALTNPNILLTITLKKLCILYLEFPCSFPLKVYCTVGKDILKMPQTNETQEFQLIAPWLIAMNTSNIPAGFSLSISIYFSSRHR